MLKAKRNGHVLFLSELITNHQLSHRGSYAKLVPDVVKVGRGGQLLCD